MKNKENIALGLLCIILMTSCTNGGSPLRSVSDKDSNTKMGPKTIDNTYSKTDGAVNDPDLYFGDLGVEQLIYKSSARSFIANDENKKQLLDPNGFPLIQQFPNPSIRPINGNYVDTIIKTAKSYIGTPYIYGSDRMEPSSFDCSDFTRWVFLYSLGMDLPWDSRSQAAYVKAFSKKTYTSLKNARRGDLLFFTSYRGNNAANYKNLKPSEKPITHVAIYLGNGRIIQSASKKSGGVQMMDIEWRQLHNRFLFGGGVFPVTR